MNVRLCTARLAFCTLFFSSIIMAPEQEPVNDTLYRWTRTLAEVMQSAVDEHYKLENIEECMIHACDGFLSVIDPHSSFLSPKSYKNITETMSGSFFGIGVIIDATKETHSKFLTILDVIPDGPADKAGVKPSDKIIDIDNNPLDGKTVEEAAAQLKGPRNTTVRIKVMREGQADLLEFAIKRDEIKEQNLLCFYLEDYNVYYLALSVFSQEAVRQFEKFMLSMHKKKPRAIIIDLRNNSGGLLTAVIDILGCLLPKNSLVVTSKDKNNTVVESYSTNRAPIEGASSIPLFILINNFSASASEIMAGNLKFYAENKAKGAKQKLTVFLVGTTTFGKGSVQKVIPLSNNCAMRMTTSLYFLPDDSSIQAVGIEPDFVIEKTMPTTKQSNWLIATYGREETFKNHIKIHEKKTETKKAPVNDDPKKWTERAKERLEQDNQLRETINLINVYHMAHSYAPQQVATRSKAVSFINSFYIASKEPIKMNSVDM